MDLPTMRTRVRRDLHDEDSQNYRWTDNELDRHIQRTLEEVSIASSREMKATLTTTADSRELSLATLTDLISIEAAEYPTGKYPPVYIGFSVWAGTCVRVSIRSGSRRLPYSAAQQEAKRG